jgi:hypothetical protein
LAHERLSWHDALRDHDGHLPPVAALHEHLLARPNARGALHGDQLVAGLGLRLELRLELRLRRRRGGIHGGTRRDAPRLRAERARDTHGRADSKRRPEARAVVVVAAMVVVVVAAMVVAVGHLSQAGPPQGGPGPDAGIACAALDVAADRVGFRAVRTTRRPPVRSY